MDGQSTASVYYCFGNPARIDRADRSPMRNAIEMVDGWIRDFCWNLVNAAHYRSSGRADWTLDRFTISIKSSIKISKKGRSRPIIQIIKQQIISVASTLSKFSDLQLYLCKSKCRMATMFSDGVVGRFFCCGIVDGFGASGKVVEANWVMTQLKLNCEPVNVVTWKLFRAVVAAHLSLLADWLLTHNNINGSYLAVGYKM